MTINIDMNGEKIQQSVEWTDEDSMSVEQLKAQLQTMRAMVDESDTLHEMIDTHPGGGILGGKKKRVHNKASIIDGTFLSVIFTIVLLMIVGVSFYAFQNLYHAILKKFPSITHTEL